MTWITLATSNATVLGLGNFIVIALTLRVLIWYAYGNNSIARFSRDRWVREGVLTTTYSMELLGGKGEVGRTLVKTHNPSTLVVRVNVNFNFRIYGEPVEYAPLCAGKELWLVFPAANLAGMVRD